MEDHTFGRTGRPRAGGEDPARREEVLVRERPRAKTPRLYRVLFHNDDYTTMEFVVDVLMRFFRKSATEAAQIMLQVHTLGVGVAGRYTREVAETKVAQVTEAAREEGFPLLLTMEPE
jgi:ATP-dependent Clp protease adaptor protein ClpS